MPHGSSKVDIPIGGTWQSASMACAVAECEPLFQTVRQIEAFQPDSEAVVFRAMDSGRCGEGRTHRHSRRWVGINSQPPDSHMQRRSLFGIGQKSLGGRLGDWVTTKKAKAARSTYRCTPRPQPD